KPIAIPVRARRTKALGTIWRAIEPGCCSRTVKLHADTMNKPRHVASIRYSCQWLVAAEIASANQVRRAVGVSATLAGYCIPSHFIVVCICLSDSSLGDLVTNP